MFGFHLSRAIDNDELTLKPFLANFIAGSNKVFQGNFPYFFHAVSIPFSSPGTATDKPPKIVFKNVKNNYQLKYHLHFQPF